MSLTDPNTIPKVGFVILTVANNVLILLQNDTTDPHPLPPTASSSLLLAHAIEQILSISTNPVFGTNTCTRCQAGLEVAKFLAMAAPDQGPALAVAICNHFKFNSDCATQYGLLGLGSVITQIVANADVGGYDGQVRNFTSLM